MRTSIVVGVDGSRDGLAAARYAAGLAARRQLPLKIIHVYESLFVGYGPLPAATDYAVADRHLRQAAEASLQADAAAVSEGHPNLTVQMLLVEGTPAAVLIQESEQALVTVVGWRGRGGFAGLTLGSVAAQVAAHGHGPVVVVRPQARPGGPVLVGFDGSQAAYAALHYGVREALDRGVPLAVANVYWEKPWGVKETPVPHPSETAQRQAHQLITDALELPCEEHPELKVEIRTLHSMNPEQTLVEESATASLTVVGCRGRGGFAGLLLGSVSRTLVHHAQSPLAVLHPADAE